VMVNRWVLISAKAWFILVRDQTIWHF